MQYLGDKSPGATVTFWFTTADADGAPAALTSGAVSVYKDADNTQSTSGVTLSASADSVTGANRVVIDTSADGTFYSAGSDFSVIITAGTVDGTSVVGYVVGRFTLRESAAYDAIADGVGLTDGAITAAKIASNAITDAKIASGALTAAKFASGAFDAVWSVTTRLLTAGTNIVLAKGTGVTGFNDLSAVEVNAEVVDALATDTYAEPGQGAPGATVSLATKIGFLYKAWRNRTTQTSTEYALYADDGTTKDQEAAVSDNGSTFERGEVTTGA